MSPPGDRTATPTTGFTLVELVVVLAIIGLLMALILPAVQSARESARRIDCRSHQKQLALALHNYHDLHGRFPGGCVFADAGGRGFYQTWTTSILPQIDQASLYDQISYDTDVPGQNTPFVRVLIPVYLCPSDPRSGSPVAGGGALTSGGGGLNYLGVSGQNGKQPISDSNSCELWNQDLRIQPKIHDGILAGQRLIRFGDITDGTSQTFLIGERGIMENLGRWAGPGFGQCPFGLADVVLPTGTRLFGGLVPPVDGFGGRLEWWSHHPGGTHFAMSDGSVRFISYSIDRQLVSALTTRSGGEVTQSEW